MKIHDYSIFNDPIKSLFNSILKIIGLKKHTYYTKNPIDALTFFDRMF